MESDWEGRRNPAQFEKLACNYKEPVGTQGRPSRLRFQSGPEEAGAGRPWAEALA